jgi:hypothetical protein
MQQDLNFEQFHEEWLASIRDGNPSTVELGNRFARKLLTQWLDIDADSDEIFYCDGSGDGGIDAAYLYENDTGSDTGTEAHTWYLVQSKFGKAFQGTSTLLKEGQKVINTLDDPRKRLASLSEDVLEQITIFRRRASERDRLILVFATENALSNSERQTLKDLRAMGRERLGPIFDVEAVSVGTIYERTLEDQRYSARRINVPIFANAASADEPTNNLLVCSVSLMNLYRFLESYHEKTGDIDQLYEKNIRRFLGGRGKVNRAIQQTLKDAPEQFGYYNNGITIVVTDFSLGGNGALRLFDPYIVNGCQTTRTIWDVLRQRLKSGGTGSDPELENWQERVKQGIVVTKIVKVGEQGEELLKKITRYTNSQNAVKEKDFLAMESDFRVWKQDMEERFGIFLEIQRGGWDSQRALQKRNPQDKEFTEFANAFDLLKVYGAGWLSEAGNAFGRNADFLPGGAVFKKIVNDEDSADVFDSEDLYAAYSLQRAADTYSFGRSGQSSRKISRYLFYTVTIELLKSVMVRGELSYTNRAITQAVNKLFESGKQGVLLDEAIEAIDEYLTPNTDNSIFDEVQLRSRNSNLNSYMKTDQIAKGEIFRRLITDYARHLGKGKPSPREQIVEIIKS